MVPLLNNGAEELMWVTLILEHNASQPRCEPSTAQCRHRKSEIGEHGQDRNTDTPRHGHFGANKCKFTTDSRDGQSRNGADCTGKSSVKQFEKWDRSKQLPAPCHFCEVAIIVRIILTQATRQKPTAVGKIKNGYRCHMHPLTRSHRIPQQMKSHSRGKGGPRENPPTNGIIQHDSHIQKSGVTLPGIELGSPQSTACLPLSTLWESASSKLCWLVRSPSKLRTNIQHQADIINLTESIYSLIRRGEMMPCKVIERVAEMMKISTATVWRSHLFLSLRWGDGELRSSPVTSSCSADMYRASQRCWHLLSVETTLHNLQTKTLADKIHILMMNESLIPKNKKLKAAQCPPNLMVGDDASPQYLFPSSSILIPTPPGPWVRQLRVTPAVGSTSAHYANIFTHTSPEFHTQNNPAEFCRPTPGVEIKGHIWSSFARAGETREPQENSLTSDIVEHDSHVQKSGSDATGDRTRFA
ncbi:hypothetical protein PR048_033224 [Dryococelus australis]|uniref:Uncharacterized protein n=1 Tax=Dryococelus australis TaxID=614101 RepID=A0ABQ9FZN5_9NEOP|nr:hypothetical protein PR048_033224 [Dryococelus australis]